MALLSALSDLRGRLQGDLFPYLAETVGRLGGKNQLLVTIFEMAPIDAFLTACPGLRGRPLADRVPLARAFIAKAVHGIATTSLLIERLAFDKTLRQLCGWQRAGAVPSEATFSRAFAQFAAAELPLRVHEALIVATHKDRPQGSATRIGYKDRLVGHVSRDATAIEAREKPVKVPAPKRCRRKRRPQKGEPGYETVRRLERVGRKSAPHASPSARKPSAPAKRRQSIAPPPRPPQPRHAKCETCTPSLSTILQLAPTGSDTTVTALAGRFPSRTRRPW